MPAILLIIAGLIFRDGTPHLFNGQGEVFTWCLWIGVVLVAIHLLFMLIAGGIFAGERGKF